MDQTSSETSMNIDKNAQRTSDKLFTLKKWNAVAMWSWDVECDTCAICRVQVMGKTISSGDIWEIRINHNLILGISRRQEVDFEVNAGWW